MLWLRPDPDEPDLHLLGISEAHVESMVGGVLAVELLPAGTHVAAGEGFGFVHGGERVYDLRAPRALELIELNPAVLADARILVASAELRGWLARVRVEDQGNTEKNRH